MGIIDLEYEREYLKFITGSLKRRGMKPIILCDWEVHGPHPGMDYQVFIGEAVKEGSDDIWLVAIYPKAVYWIEDSSEWCNAESGNRILIKGGEKKYATKNII